MAADQPRRHAPPPGPTRSRNGAATRIGIRAVAARPNRSPTTTWRGSSANHGRAERADATGAGATASPPSAAGSSAVGSAPIASPHASIVRPTATMCAWYQVVRELGREPEHRPEREERRRGRPDREPDVEAPEHPPADRHIHRGEEREQTLVVGREAPHGDEGQQQHGRQAAGTAAGRAAMPSEVTTGRTSWK